MAQQITPFNFGGINVRIILRGNEPWFVAADVCAALDYKNTSKALADHLDDDERYNEQLDRGGSLTLINESGLYALVLRSRKPEARKFAKWVTSEVLPSIRKTGGYQTPQTPTAAFEQKNLGWVHSRPVPRLHFQQPPPVGCNRAGGRTIEAAQTIARAIEGWARHLPDATASRELQHAAQTLHALLVTGWTEVDEALSMLSLARRYLNRWQGRGGAVGNIR